jgi:hypothetical protein
MAISFANGFACEPSWIEAALRELAEDSSLFHTTRMEETMKTFGIGNRKVEALSAWLRGMALCNGTLANMQLTTLGRLIRSQDPQLRRPGTWWVLHFMLALPGSRSDMVQQLWQWYANEQFPFGFTTESIRQAAGRAFPAAAERTIRTGLAEVLKTLERTPLANFGLMQLDPTMGPNQFCKTPPAPETFTLPLLLAGVGQQMENADRDTLNFDELANLPGGAARVVNQSRSVMLRMVEGAAARYGSHLVAITRTAGLDSIWLRERSAAFWLACYFAEQGSVSGRHTEEKIHRLLTE